MVLAMTSFHRDAIMVIRTHETAQGLDGVKDPSSRLIGSAGPRTSIPDDELAIARLAIELGANEIGAPFSC